MSVWARTRRRELGVSTNSNLVIKIKGDGLSRDYLIEGRRMGIYEDLHLQYRNPGDIEISADLAGPVCTDFVERLFDHPRFGRAIEQIGVFFRDGREPDKVTVLKAIGAPWKLLSPFITSTLKDCLNTTEACEIILPAQVR